MSILSTSADPVNPADDALAALDQFLTARGCEALRSQILDLAAGRPPAAVDPSTGVPWEVFKAEVLAQYSPQLRQKSTLQVIKHAIGVLDDLGLKHTSELNVQLIAKVVATRPSTLSPNSVRGLLRCISALCGHAVSFGYLAVSPFARRPIRTWVRASKPRGVKHLTKVQIRAILDVLAQDVRDRQGWALYREAPSGPHQSGQFHGAPPS